MWARRTWPLGGFRGLSNTIRLVPAASRLAAGQPDLQHPSAVIDIACVVQLPVPVNYMFTSDWVDELQVDATLPQQEGLLTYNDLNVLPRRIDEGVAIEHIRYYRVGGYDLGTTGTGPSQQSGGGG